MRDQQPRQGGRNQRSRSRGRKNSNPLSRNYESNGPDIKVRGNAQHIAEKYTNLARDISSSGDRVMAENYLQHAEHYLRIVAAAQQQMQPQGQGTSGQANGRDNAADADSNTAESSGETEEAAEATEESADSVEQAPAKAPRRRQPRQPRASAAVVAPASDEGGDVDAGTPTEQPSADEADRQPVITDAAQ